MSPVSGTLDKTTGNTIDETMTDAWSSNLYHLGGTVGSIGARVFNSAAISVANATDTALTFNSEQYDNDPNGAIHDTGSNTSRLTCRTAGFYLVGGCVEFAANATGFRQVSLRVNGATPIAIQTTLSLGGADATRLTVHAVYSFFATDYVELMAYQNSTGALNATAGGNYTPYFWIVKV